MSAERESLHQPVLVNEVVSCLEPTEGDVILDCTFGSGGHANVLMDELGSGGVYLALDWDPESIRNAAFDPEEKECDLQFKQGNFARARDLLDEWGIMNVDAVLADLGWSMDQLRHGGKGLSFEQDEFLDMRLNPDAQQAAADLLHSASKTKLTELFQMHGEHRFGRDIAQKIVEERDERPFRRTYDLLDAIASITGDYRKNETAARIFQALRVEVNRELENLERLLELLPDLLRPQGRAGVISFHSLEDRRVKEAFLNGQEAGYYRQITEKPIQPGKEEVKNNASARSAKLRAIEYTGA